MNQEIETKSEGRLGRINRKLAVASLVMLAIVGTASPSFATLPVDPMAGALTTARTKTQTWVTTIAVPAMTLAIIFGVIVAVGFKWLRRIGKRVGA